MAVCLDEASQPAAAPTEHNDLNCQIPKKSKIGESNG